jgi:hypothetical protein
MQFMRNAGLIFDDSVTYLDHLGPFCALAEWPLILTDPDLIQAARDFYPSLSVLEADLLSLPQALRSLHTLVSCSPRILLNTVFASLTCNTLWLPHGHSDKGRISHAFHILQSDETALVYGQKMADWLTEENIKSPMSCVGRFRYIYYQKWRSFYDALPIFSFEKSQTTILYAPTWDDMESRSSVWTALPSLAERLPNSINLLVKLHPNTIQYRAAEVERLIGQYEKPNLLFLSKFLPIAPILQRCDAYLGDRSSIGYDFLLFDRPLFFLDSACQSTKISNSVFNCGEHVTPESFFQQFAGHDPAQFTAQRRAMADYVFAPTDSPHAKYRFIGLA